MYVESEDNPNYLRWYCTLEKDLDQTNIILWRTATASEERMNLYQAIRSLRVFNRDGEQVASTAVNTGVDYDKTFTVPVQTKSIRFDDHLEFEVVLSENEFVHKIGRVAEQVTMETRNILAALMGDIATQDFAFTFGLNGSARNVSLWAHQSVLSQWPVLAKLIGKLKVIEGASTDSGNVATVKSIHVSEYSLQSYCTLIRFFYTGKVGREVDLKNFGVGQPPNRPFSVDCKSRPAINVLLEPQSSLPSAKSDELADPTLIVTWSELFQVAYCYQVTELGEYCRDKIIEELDTSTALDVLFGFAYRYPDLKLMVLRFVANAMEDLYEMSHDPFSSYAEHPQRHELMSEALHIVFSAKAHNREP
ncbi:hypothetical protein BG000_001195 [Podila horticola]|nr:hypothetical protein BG000_001195 [Podila horticola]